MKSKLKKGLKIIKNIVGYGAMLVLVAVTIFVTISNAKGQTPFIGDYSVMLVVSDSMKPTIPGRSSILVEKVDPALIKENDVIVFISEDPSIQGMRNTHRVIRVLGNGEGFVTKGDNNAGEDRYTVKPEKVVGRFVKVLPMMTRLSRLLASGTGFFIIALIVVGITAAMYLPGLKKALREQTAEDEKAHKDYIDSLVKEEVKRLMEAEGQTDAPTEDKKETPAEETR